MSTSRRSTTHPAFSRRTWAQRLCQTTLLAVLAPAGAHAQPTLPPTWAFQPVHGLNRPVHIDASTSAPAQTLADALNAGRSVTLCNVDIDMSGFKQLQLNYGQSLRAQAGCERSPTRPGPRIFVTDKRDAGTPLFVILDSQVQLSGFRLQGPNAGLGSGRADREYGIQIAPHPDALPGDPGGSPGAAKHLLHHVQITNMEIYHWSGAAIDLADTQSAHPKGRMTLANAAGVLIEGNSIHHNRHKDGFGYGVNVGKGAYATVRANAFEENRHAMAGDSVSDDGGDFSGYVFHDNLVLPGGGVHCRESFPEVCWRTHQIDMHGTKSETLAGQHCCGQAGETMLIERNTLLYQGGYRQVGVGPLERRVWEWGLAIKIRGNPTGRVLVDANVFAAPHRGKAVAQNGDGIRQGPNGQWLPSITRPVEVTANNRWDARPLNQLKRCDFDGDGKLDDFMASGVNWWVRSGATGQWRYLGTRTEPAGTLSLRDVDGDGLCDVVKPTRNGLQALYAHSGTGPWLPLAGTLASPGVGR